MLMKQVVCAVAWLRHEQCGKGLDTLAQALAGHCNCDWRRTLPSTPPPAAGRFYSSGRHELAGLRFRPTASLLAAGKLRTGLRCPLALIVRSGLVAVRLGDDLL